MKIPPFFLKTLSLSNSISHPSLNIPLSLFLYLTLSTLGQGGLRPEAELADTPKPVPQLPGRDARVHGEGRSSNPTWGPQARVMGSGMLEVDLWRLEAPKLLAFSCYSSKLQEKMLGRGNMRSFGCDSWLVMLGFYWMLMSNFKASLSWIFNIFKYEYKMREKRWDLWHVVGWVVEGKY